MISENSRLLKGYLRALGCEALFGLSYIFTKQAALQTGALSLLGRLFLTAAVFMSLCAYASLISIQIHNP